MLKYNIFYICVLAVFAAGGTSCENKSPAQNPNVILILTDDQGYGDVHIHGNDSISTPNMDLLGTEGVRLDRFYVSPVCAPTRASLLTGRYHLRTGTHWVTHGGENMHEEEVTLAELFQANGYATGIFGKCIKKKVDNNSHISLKRPLKIRFTTSGEPEDSLEQDLESNKENKRRKSERLNKNVDNELTDAQIKTLEIKDPDL